MSVGWDVKWCPVSRITTSKQSCLFLGAGINNFRLNATLVYKCGSLSHETTIKDILNYKEEDIKAYLKQEIQKVSGLARRALEHNRLKLRENADDTPSFETSSDPTVHVIPSINELIDGWFSDFSDSIDPPVTQKDIENYLIKSSNRTCDNHEIGMLPSVHTRAQVL